MSEKINKRLALKADPVELAYRLISIVIDGCEADEAEVTLSFSRSAKSVRGLNPASFPGTCCRISYGGTSTYYEAPNGNPKADTYSLQSIFKYLGQALAYRREADLKEEREEKEEQEKKSQHHRNWSARYRAAVGLTDVATCYTPDMSFKDALVEAGVRRGYSTQAELNWLKNLEDRGGSEVGIIAGKDLAKAVEADDRFEVAQDKLIDASAGVAQVLAALKGAGDDA